MKASPEMKDLLIKYFIPNLKESFNEDYFQHIEKTNEDSVRYFIQIQNLCKEEKLPSKAIFILYYAGLHFKDYYSFKSNIKESFTGEEEGLLQLTEAALLINQIWDNNIEEMKIQLSFKKTKYHKSNNTITAEITDKKILKKLIVFIFKLYLSEEKKIKAPGYGIKLEDKISEDYLLKLQNDLIKMKDSGRPATKKHLIQFILKLSEFLHKETQIKNDTKIISDNQAKFIYDYLDIFKLNSYKKKAEYPEEKTSRIRAIIQPKA